MPKKSVIDEIREAVLADNRTRYQISKLCGVDQAALSRFAAGASLRVESLEAIATALGLEIVVRKRKAR
jgi:hypothetical protein